MLQFLPSPCSFAAGRDVPQHADEVQSVCSLCAVPEHRNKRGLAPACCGHPGLCHLSQRQPGPPLPPWIGELGSRAAVESLGPAGEPLAQPQSDVVPREHCLHLGEQRWELPSCAAPSRCVWRSCAICAVLLLRAASCNQPSRAHGVTPAEIPELTNAGFHAGCERGPDGRAVWLPLGCSEPFPLCLFRGVLWGHCQSSASFLRQATCLPLRTCSPAAWLGAWPWAGELQVPMNCCRGGCWGWGPGAEGMSWGWRERDGHGHCKALLPSAQDEAHAEAFKCRHRHFQGKLSLTWRWEPARC